MENEGEEQEKTFRCYRIFKEVVEEKKKFTRKLVDLKMSELPEGNVLIKVHYAGLNYKDCLSCQGHPGVTRKFPHTPGIDAAGVVESSEDEKWKPGDKVIVTGFYLGMSHHGGFSEYIRVPGEWVVPLPESMSLKESMMYGTAGITAAQAVWKLLKGGQKPEMGPLVVTGAAGGVGSVACLILKKLGFQVWGATSSIETGKEFISKLGVDKHIDKAITDDQSGKPMGKTLWAGGIDMIGGNTLVTLLKSCSYGGNVASVGLVGGDKLNLTVYPFIIRAVSLIGIGSQDFTLEQRALLWEKLANDWKPEKLYDINTTCTLDDLDKYMDIMIGKKSRGHVVCEIFNEEQ